ncbi:V-type ATP synthase subunit E family protein [Thiococcus pfennigii]|uniref:V-type ATP synthase subunit E family protein n=1 Tax=Thiococcus pfennigii TaxID=1057 RepID=UPI001906857C|nr:ATPase [Thiococcus pfennigii]
MSQVDDLEQAILARAEQLARQYRERANRSRDNILREAAEKRRLREQREEASARALGERAFRQQVQASELTMQSQLDRTRWNLMQSVERRLAERMRLFMTDEDAYLAFLKDLIVASAHAIEDDRLEVLANAADIKRLPRVWETVAAALPERDLRLVEEPLATLGGVLVRSADRRIRVDNSFEGRLARLGPQITQVIFERLLPSGLDTGNLFTG